MTILAKSLHWLNFSESAKGIRLCLHDILLAKLKHYGIRGPRNWLMETFLDRSQYTRINSIDSEIKSVKYGVAQGSTLGPLLFLLYINDLPNSACSLPRSFADDQARRFLEIFGGVQLIIIRTFLAKARKFCLHCLNVAIAHLMQFFFFGIKSFRK